MLSFNNSEVPYFPFIYRQGCSAVGAVDFQELLIPNAPVVIRGNVAKVSRGEAREQSLLKCSSITPRWF